MLAKIALRGVTRNKRRTLLTLAAIALAVASLVVMNAFMDGSAYHVEHKVVEFSGMVQLFAPGYYDEMRTLPTDIAIGNLNETMERIQSMEGVTEASAQVRFSGLATMGGADTPGVFIGIEPSVAGRMNRLSEMVREGRYLRDDDEDGCLVGRRLAEIMKVGVGDTLTCVTQTAYGALTAVDLQVLGIVSTGNPLVDESGVLLRLEDAQRHLELPDAATVIMVNGPEINRSAELRDSLLAELNRGVDLSAPPAEVNDSLSTASPEEDPLFLAAQPTGGFSEPEAVAQAPTRHGFEGYTWQELNYGILDLMNMREQIMDIVRVIMIILVMVMIVNTMLTNVFERVREIGVLMAMGARPGQVLLQFLAESGVLGLMGSLLGIVVGAGIGWYFAQNGIDLGDNIQSFNIPMDTTIYALVLPEKLVSVFLLGLVMSLVAGLYPAAKAARLQPTKALRYI